MLIAKLVILKAGKSCLKSFTAERRLGQVYVQVGIVSYVQLESLRGILQVLQPSPRNFPRTHNSTTHLPDSENVVLKSLSSSV